jgi:hypothetical protein
MTDLHDVVRLRYSWPRSVSCMFIVLHIRLGGLMNQLQRLVVVLIVPSHVAQLVG